ncbi:unnamed protein product [Didymodactylos carnosus]|uniref:Uncharacterized protein n=1 Tax=Didymodactylos carnosus TaxID=1234261 RepID=A0A816DV71_9BILA|nr:unnamed protein product [Didymodactylos carnosus]CAF4548592.1 unnamed protein product [Didymodactylos carnosus]
MLWSSVSTGNTSDIDFMSEIGRIHNDKQLSKTKNSSAAFVRIKLSSDDRRVLSSFPYGISQIDGQKHINGFLIRKHYSGLISKKSHLRTHICTRRIETNIAINLAPIQIKLQQITDDEYEKEFRI